jgi:ornithine--oxo-acid transaminase
VKTQKLIISEIESYSAHNYNPLPVVLSQGDGVWVWDTDGKKYLDCLSAYSALNQGHRHPRIIQALKDQADRITLSSRAFHNDQMGSFLKLLCNMCEMECALPMNSGAEAVETAIKLARKWGYQKKGVAPDQAEIIVCTNNFHGRTITIVSFSTETQYREGFAPFTPGFKIIPFGDSKALEKAISPNTVGFLYEPIQGEAGVIVPPTGYLSEVIQICKKHRVLAIADEIQTGLGRTGKLFCYQHESDSKPDVLVLGKALGGGVIPISAVLASKSIMDVFHPGDHGSTFGGNPLAAAVGSASLKVLVEENLPERSAELGSYLRKELEKIQSSKIQEIRGKGLMVGIEIKASLGNVRPLCEELAKLGILVKDTHEQVIRITPPLIIEKNVLDMLVQQLKKVLEEPHS